MGLYDHEILLVFQLAFRLPVRDDGGLLKAGKADVGLRLEFAFIGKDIASYTGGIGPVGLIMPQLQKKIAGLPQGKPDRIRTQLSYILRKAAELR